MRSEARSLEALLEVLSQRIHDSRTELTMISQHLMQLGDEATGKLGGITREFDSSSEKLKRHGEALDRAAEAARNDIAVLLDDLPRAEADARERRRAAALGRQRIRRTRPPHSGSRSASSPSARARPTSWSPKRRDRLAARLAEIETAGAARRGRVGEAEAAFSGALDALLDRTSTTLERDPLRHRRPGGRRRRAGRAGFRRDRQGRRRRRRIARRQRRPCQQPRSKACRAASPSRTAPRSG